MKILCGCCIEHKLRAFGDIRGRIPGWYPEDDVEFRWDDGEELFVRNEPREQLFCRVSAFLQVRREIAVAR